MHYTIQSNRIENCVCVLKAQKYLPMQEQVAKKEVIVNCMCVCVCVVTWFVCLPYDFSAPAISNYLSILHILKLSIG